MKTGCLLVASLALLAVPAFAGPFSAPTKSEDGPLSEEEAIKLSRETLLLFSEAIQKADFSRFHKSISKALAEEMSPEQLKTSFQAFIDKKFDLSEIKNLEPVFTAPPKLNSDGLLVLNGTYPTKPLNAVFNLEYMEEKSQWKLTGINVKLNADIDKSDAAKSVPSKKEAEELILETLLAFDDGVQKKNFADFHKQISKLWQDQVTPEQLSISFQDFTAKGIYMSGIKELEPVFDPAPAVNPQGILILKGHYPSKPLKLTFLLKYVRERGDWKLFGVNVDVQ